MVLSCIHSFRSYALQVAWSSNWSYSTHLFISSININCTSLSSIAILVCSPLLSLCIMSMSSIFTLFTCRIILPCASLSIPGSVLSYVHINTVLVMVTLIVFYISSWTCQSYFFLFNCSFRSLVYRFIRLIVPQF